MQEEDRNQWIHAYVLRQPLYCQGALQELPEVGDTLRTRAFGCRECRRIMYVSRYELEHTSIQNIVGPHGHRHAVPTYTQDPSLVTQLLTTLGERDQKSGLLYHLLRRMGVAHEDLPLSPDVLKMVFQMEMMGHIPTKIIEKIYSAHQDMQQSDWKDFPDSTHHLLDRLSHRWNRSGVRLFARVGGPVDTLHSWDLPYALCSPSVYFYDQVYVLVWQRDSWDSYPPQHINTFGQTLKKEFRKVDGPARIDHGMHCYWGFHVQF